MNVLIDRVCYYLNDLVYFCRFDDGYTENHAIQMMIVLQCS